MDRYNNTNYYSYSWHQSHDQATVLVIVPHDTQMEDVAVVVERNYLLVKVEGQAPIVKGRLYSNVSTTNSVWQLEPRKPGRSGRERTASTISTSSTQSSYAFVSDPEISSSFAASLESGQVSDAEDISPSPALSSPSMSSDERVLPPRSRRRPDASAAASRSVSPGHALRSMTSSYSSLESLQSPNSGKLLTLHLEKEQSVIWPSLIVGPAPEYLSPLVADSIIFDASLELEHQYNMDPTSLVLIGLELFDIRRDKDEAFEYFVRAWHQAHVPTAAMRLASHYLPISSTCNQDITEDQTPAPRGTVAYYLQCVGGRPGLAQLYFDAGLLHLEGAATTLLSASYSSLSSIRVPLHAQVGEGGTEAWMRDREAAAEYFGRARLLEPSLEIPSLPLTDPRHDAEELEMPSIDTSASEPGSRSEASHYADAETSMLRRRRKKEEMGLFDNRIAEQDADIPLCTALTLALIQASSYQTATGTMSTVLDKPAGDLEGSSSKSARVVLPQEEIPQTADVETDEEPVEEISTEEQEEGDFLEDFPDETEELELVNSRIGSLENLRLPRFAQYLKRLCLRQNSISFLDPEVFHQLTNLEELDLYDNKIKTIGNALDKLSKLSVLDLSFNLLRAVPEGLELLTSLHTVYFVQNRISKINNLASCTNLRSLELGGNRIRKIENLESLVNLEELWLGKNKIAKLENLGTLKKLRILSMQSNRITKLENLEELENLEQLYLSHNGIERLENLEHNTKLTTLDVGNNFIPSIENISHLTSLEELWISGNQIPDLTSLVPQLGGMKSLETLYLEANPCQTKDMTGYRRKVMLALPQLKQIDATYVRQS
ncbi:putative thiamin pyrophosphokinase, catalytic domain [Lyophyllum shimeji]|uniref:Thiamin pyrophosphokinase, catalytic domain n=1 Tax=Lyophyllum shimeji TaxID=47721 RepID=A0A9P3UPD1_LYOSH|nr:putative thiamin pyrophosphokinase, catalytic domain [Lyophyllum shimeji]